MKYALQIYGQFRSFRRCLPDLLQYIGFDIYDYDVFILSQRGNTASYSPENEAEIRQLFKGKIKTFSYIDDYPPLHNAVEGGLVSNYMKGLEEARHQVQSNLVNNEFVSRLWYRRHLANQLRLDYEQKTGTHYDWVVRTRLDIRFRPHATSIPNAIPFPFLATPPNPAIVYLYADIITFGCPEAINYEGHLYSQWPYAWNYFKRHNKFPTPYPAQGTPEAPEYFRMWIFMSEANQLAWFYQSPFQPLQIIEVMGIDGYW